jgi:transposase
MVWEQREDAEVFDDYRLAISQIEDRLRGLDGRIEALSQEAPYREPVGWLRCFRGIDTVTAMTTVCEVHGFSRFQSAGALMAYLGLVPTEHSSGDRRRQGGITKTGNSHVRRVLVESAWTARHKPAVGYKLRKRRQGQPAWAIAHADRAMRRLWRRYHYLEARGKPQNKIVAAVARELVGFIWAMLQEGSLRNETQRGTGIVKGVRGHHGVSRRVA